MTFQSLEKFEERGQTRLCQTTRKLEQWLQQILIVDDVPEIRRLLKMILMNDGYEVHEAEDGLAGIQALSGSSVDMVICDKQMPNLDGIQFTKLVRSNPEFCTLPILMLSANTEPSIVKMGLSAGVNEWMGKPFSRRQITDAVKRLLDK